MTIGGLPSSVGVCADPVWGSRVMSVVTIPAAGRGRKSAVAVVMGCKERLIFLLCPVSRQRGWRRDGHSRRLLPIRPVNTIPPPPPACARLAPAEAVVARRSRGTDTMPANGKVTQVIGSTFDAEFPEDQLPEIYNALRIDAQQDGTTIRLTGEVQQHLGGGRVRAVALGSTDGLRRGVECSDTGSPVT